MGMIDTSLRRPVTVIVCTLCLIFFGVVSYRTMGMQQMPDVDLPVVMVTTTMRGATPTVMDNDVTDVLEDQLSGISGIDSMSSSSYTGVAVTVLQFDINKNVDAAAADVRDKVSAAAKELPLEADQPIISKFSTSDRPVVMVAVTGRADYASKVDFVDKIAKAQFQSVPGVGNFIEGGLRKREMRIWIDPVRLRSRELVVQDLVNAIRAKHVELPAGDLEIGKSRIDVRLNGEYDSAEALRTLPVAVQNGTVVRLGDVADVENGFADATIEARYNGSPTILLAIGKQRGANEVAVSEAIVQKLDEIKRLAPQGIELSTIYNQSTFVKQSMAGVTNDAFMAVFLCALVMFFFLQTVRATIVTCVTMPVSLLSSFIFMKALGITINDLSMMGISLAVGMVVDATVVVLENVDRHMKNGETALRASSIGTREVSFSVLGGALTTVAVFAPIAFMGGVIGKFFFAFGTTVVVTILISLVASLTLTPFLCSRLLLRAEHPNRLARWCEARIEALERGYRYTLALAVRHKFVTMSIALAAFAFGLFIQAHVGKSFLPINDNGIFTIQCELSSGTSLDESMRTLDAVADEARKNKAVNYTFTIVGAGDGKEVNKGTVYVKLIDGRRPGLQRVMAEERRRLAGFRDVKMNFTTFSGKDVEMVLVGGDTQALLKVAQRMKSRMESTGKIIDVDTDIRMDKPQLDVTVNRPVTDVMNLDIGALSSEIQAYFGGIKAGVYKEKGYRYDIRLMARKSGRSSVDDLKHVFVHIPGGNIVQVPGLMSVTETKVPTSIKRYNRQKSVTISANVTAAYSSGQAIEYMSRLAKEEIPPDSGMNLVASGRTKMQQEDFGRLFFALIVAITLVYVVMAIQFESFVHPFTVMFSLPLMTPGAFGMLWLTGCNLDMMSYLGLILLVGIVVNNGIILVDFINQSRAKGLNCEEAVLAASPLRLRPILITAIATLMGAVPAALKLSIGSETRQPMSVVLFGGLFTSTLLTLFVIPVVYLLVESLRCSLGRLWQRIGRRSSVPVFPGAGE